MYMLNMHDTRPTRAGAPPLEPGRAETQTAGSFPPRPALTWVAGGCWVGEHLALFEPPHPAPRRAAAPRAARRARRVPVPAAAPWRRRGGAMGGVAALRAARGTEVSQFLHSLPTHTCVMRV